MTLGDKQRKFSLMIAKLIVWAYEQGYEITVGDFLRDKRVFGEVGKKQGYGRASSLHKLKLAADLNLFKDKVWLTETSDHQEIGEKWESMGGSWGGRFNDGNHYSLEHNGMR